MVFRCYLITISCDVCVLMNCLRFGVCIGILVDWFAFWFGVYVFVCFLLLLRLFCCFIVLVFSVNLVLGFDLFGVSCCV